MNINELEGRELDAKVATEVMGWIYWDSDFRDYDGEYPMYIVLNALLLVYDEANKHREFSPSTDIAAAMLVVEKMRERYGCGIRILAIATDQIARVRAKYVCIIHGGTLEYDTPSLEVTERADTAPLAICRAALMAAEVRE